MSSRLDKISDQRLEKLQALEQRGVNAYPNRYKRSHNAAQAIELLEQAEAAGGNAEDVSVAGRLTALRKMGKSTFADLRDASGKIQLLFQNTPGLGEAHASLFQNLDIGDIIGAQGQLIRTKSGEPTVNASHFTMLAKSLQPLPEKWHGLVDVDTRYRQRYLDLIANAAARETFITRSKVIAAMRRYLDQRGFMEVETPVLQPSAGGALASPFVTQHHALGQDFYLRIALELHLKRLIVGGLEKVYELGRVFRNEGVSTRHNPEFTMMESYEAYADYDDVMAMLEEVVAGICLEVTSAYDVTFGENTVSFKPPWTRLGLRQAVEKYAGIDYESYPDALSLAMRMRELGMEADANKGWARLVDDLISEKVEPNLVQPTFLVDYPVAMSPLAKTKPGEEGVVERFEAFCGCMEIANAFTELNDPRQQRERFQHQLGQRQSADGERWTIDEDYLTALEYGMPPTGGLGVGIDRLVMLLTNQHSIREVILFPQLKDKP